MMMMMMPVPAAGVSAVAAAADDGGADCCAVPSFQAREGPTMRAKGMRRAGPSKKKQGESNGRLEAPGIVIGVYVHVVG